MNLALGCDVRIAARRAKFDTRFMQLGLHPGGGHTWMLRRIAGPQVTMAAVLFGEVLDGEEAARVGLALRCVDDDELLPAAQAMAARAASAPRELVITHEADDRRDGRPSPTIRPPSPPSSNRSCGAPVSRGSPSVWPPFSHASAAVRREVE